MNRFEMPKMNIAKFSFEDIITTSAGITEPTTPEEAAQVLVANGVEESNIFSFKANE